MLLLLLLVSRVLSSDNKPAFLREIEHAKDISPPTNDASLVQDPGQNKFVGYDGGTVFTRNYATGFKEECFQSFITGYALDFEADGTYISASDSWYLNGFLLFPFINGLDYRYRQTGDTDDKSVREKNNRFLIDAGYVAIFVGVPFGNTSSNGKFAGGKFVNATYNSETALCYTRYHYFDEEDRGKNVPDKVKDFRTTNCNPSIRRKNAYGLEEQYFTGIVTDKQNRTGFGSVHISSWPGENGVPYQRLRTLITYNYTDS